MNRFVKYKQYYILTRQLINRESMDIMRNSSIILII
nr:MAG TPA: hypothetical protein [Caudoviricetes sp.]